MPDWQEEGFVLGTHRHGENAVIVSLFTREHGRHLGLTHSKKLPLAATFVQAKWHARLSDHLGNYTLEYSNSFSAKYMDDKKRLAALSCLCSLLDLLLPERESLPSFYDSLKKFLSNLGSDSWQMQYVRLEALLLSAIGFGMDLSRCAGGGDSNNLAYVSPKTARAVSQEKGNPYKEKLLPLPRFLWQDVPATPQDLRNGLYLTGYFLSRQVEKLPITRGQIL